MDELLAKLGSAIVSSPFLAIMIQDDDHNVVWHNELFGKRFSRQGTLIGKKCYEVTGSVAKHSNCPSETALRESKHVSGWLDFGEENFWFLTVPLDAKHAAEIHVLLPKVPDNKFVTG